MKEPNLWPEWMQVETAARYADVPPGTIRRWIKRGLDHVKIGDCTPSIKRTTLDKWMAEKASEPVSC
ncbi:hypothetical protein TBK1r_75660 [Stieleria magnilauensis]|uniref:Helix-turn-helix domain protein n=1 Tax=Stieleria magnilauensis TaxID=2527963 RepID=A0ABX5Y410_9BACT|nr:hypothetical protein TBK1r_75660 [Planctomycetes bacterium TBK1r]